MSSKYTIKQIFTDNGAIYNFIKDYEKKNGRLREDIYLTIAKILSCKNIVRGFLKYECSNKQCTHSKRVFFTCKSKSCSSCGKKATEDWINKQIEILPEAIWQHITFTMPGIFGGKPEYKKQHKIFVLVELRINLQAMVTYRFHKCAMAMPR